MRDFQTPGRSLVMAMNAMAATSHPLATKTAIETLEAGGNAVDAAVAAAVLLGVCEPQMTGIGGDCFALIKPAGSEDLVGLNASGRAPAALEAARLRAAGHGQMPEHSADAVTIPGAVDGFATLAGDWGRLGLARCLAPAIRYAEEGVPVASRVAHDWANLAGFLQGKAREDFLIGGKAPGAGQVFRLPKQAEALRRIAEKGRSGFYEGEVAEDMVASLNALGGCHTLKDFAANTPTYVDPLSGTYRGTELIELPPNGQGIAAILMANILSEFDLAALDPFGPDRVHLMTEAARLAYDARDRFVADPEYAARFHDHILSPETARRLAGLIDMSRAMDLPVALRTEAIHKDTIYLCVVDKDRMAVSLIYSIFHGFGSGLASDKFSILFHNRGAGFSLTEGHPNEAAGGKRPMHTIIPGMLRQHGRLTTSFGVMGGQYQSAGHAQFLTNVTDFGMDIQTAIDAPRSFPDGDELRMESTFPEATRADLAARGHQIVTAPGPLGGAQAIHIDPATGLLTGASDPRKDGCALGY